MKTNHPYSSPEIERIQLDSTISLQMASDADPMEEPDWASRINETHTSDPMQPPIV